MYKDSIRESTAFLCTLEFCDLVLHFLQVYWRTLHPTISFKLLGDSHVLRFVQREEAFTKSRPIGDWRKISWTCNHLILISDSWEWWLEIHSIRFSPCERFSPLINKLPCQFTFHCTLSYLLICSCFHDITRNLILLINFNNWIN